MVNFRSWNLRMNFSYCIGDRNLYVFAFIFILDLLKFRFNILICFCVFRFMRDTRVVKARACTYVSLSRSNWRVEQAFWMRYVSFVAVSCSQEERIWRKDRVLFVYDVFILEHLTFFRCTTWSDVVCMYLGCFSFFWIIFCKNRDNNAAAYTATEISHHLVIPRVSVSLITLRRRI